jgi:pyruvate dehydrogenase E2 component (dihydrolipoamide acetyltransferase)
MATDVVMPQMGESIAEGTVSRWLKKQGERVERDEPLLEISTDKVDAEIPSPAAGTLAEILVQEGQTVPVNSVVARIAAEGEASVGQGAPAGPEAPARVAAEAPATPQSTEQQASQAMQQKVRQEAFASIDAQQPQTRVSTPPAPAVAPTEHDEEENVTTLDERRRTKSSPLVRKIAKENNVDISHLSGTGVSGRVTKNDILDFLQQPHPAAQQPAVSAAPAPRAPQPMAPQQTTPERVAAPQFAPGENVRVEPLSVMRKKIAKHMVLSKQTSAHVTTVFELDFTAIDKLRRQHKQSYAERGVKLTYMPFVLEAVIAGLRQFPIINASMDENNIIYHRELNIGIAVALDWGLIVPVVKHADEKNILGLARVINDLGERARSKKLSPDEVQGGTFTITNPGIYGGLFGTPIISQPQVAILGVGGVKKRPVVIEMDEGDFIAIRSMCIMSLTFDHRLIDGAVADQFMAYLREIIEGGNFAM